MWKLWATTGLAFLLATLALDVVAPAVAQNWAVPDRGFRVEWETVTSRRGPALRGYIHNDLGYAVDNVRLVVDSVDAAGQVVASSVAYARGTVPPFNRLYFEVPVKAPATAYRVRVAAWDPVGRGGA